MSDVPVIDRVEQKTPDDPEFIFHCPGCGYGHWFKTTGDSPCWTFNGDMVKPTVQPSLLVDQNGPHRCHSFIEVGNIRFLDDCWHDLKGKTVPLEPL